MKLRISQTKSNTEHYVYFTDINTDKLISTFIGKNRDTAEINATSALKLLRICGGIDQERFDELVDSMEVIEDGDIPLVNLVTP